MHIKQVIIEGFKSYKEQIEIEPFDPKVNCIVGANGSGKSNFFFAIRFVLSDLFQSLRVEDRQSFLHEGAGNQVLFAFVEIVFDNKDGRIPVDRAEVRLRRTIGSKKDEYFLDKKHITKSEVLQLLESAGFSKSNPYYIVQQGKIAFLTLMKDSERLELLKEIGGTRIYEERREESLKIMQATETRRKQIIESIAFIDERLKELDEEKSELGKYQKLEKQFRCLQYTMFEKQLSECKKEIDDLDAARLQLSEKSSEIHTNAFNTNERLREIEKKLKNLSHTLETSTKDKNESDKLRSDAIRNATKLKIDLNEFKSIHSNENVLKEQLRKELIELENQIKNNQNELSRILPDYESKLSQENEVQKNIANLEKELNQLYQKQSRTKQFQTKRERNQFLNNQVKEIQNAIEKCNMQQKVLSDELQKLNEEINEISLLIESKINESKRNEDALSKCKNDISILKNNLNSSRERQKLLWKRESETSIFLENLKEEFSRAEKILDQMTPGEIRRALHFLRKLIKDHNINGVHGCVIELINCEDKFNTCVEVTAGNGLFYLVVENDDIATRLVKYLNQNKAGRITFIPLNQAKSNKVKFPTHPDIVPLIRKMNFDKKFENAFEQIFGRTVICKNLNVATSVSQQHNIDCITLEGSQVESKGAMIGGHYDLKSSKLSFIKIIKENKTKIVNLENELSKLKEELTHCDQGITIKTGELQNLDAKEKHLYSIIEQSKADIRLLQNEKASMARASKQKEKSIQDLNESIADFKSTVGFKKDEIDSAFSDTLSAEDSRKVSDLISQIESSKSLFLTLKTQRMEVETKKKELEEVLNENLLKRRNELNDELEEKRRSDMEERIQSMEKELENAEKEVNDAERNLTFHTQEVDRMTKEESNFKKEREECLSLKAEYSRILEDETKDLGQILSKRSLNLHKRDELAKKIRDLGSLPSDAFDKYQKLSLKEVHKKLHKCQQELKKYDHVNKKAMNQYDTFIQHKEELRKRKEEMDRDDNKIKELISILDMRKDELIERTFKGVARNFSDVFAELVPGGRASLVMLKKTQQVGEDDFEDEEDHEKAKNSIEKYKGVKVKVSFSTQGETQTMKQLSGGQKTVVALCLIFAIQRCDPAPFYLFDEIDAALDAQYRTAVANMIRRQADTSLTQFILTTFRAELVGVSDKVYGISLRNKVSKVDVVTKESALQFIEEDRSHRDE